MNDLSSSEIDICLNQHQNEISEHKNKNGNILTTPLTFSNSKLIRHLCRIQHVDEHQLEIRERVWCCAWQYTGKLLASCGEDKTIKVWKYAIVTNSNNNAEAENSLESVTLEAFCTIRGDQKKSIRCVCFSPCGRYLAAAGFDATIIVYQYQSETSEFEELHRLEGHESEVKCCAFSISGHYLATCSRDKSVWVWKVDEDDMGDRDCEVLSILQQHTADVKFVVWHSHEDMLISGGYDCTIRFYTFDCDDWITAQAITDAHDETIWSAAFEPITGKHLVTVGGDKCVKIWTKTSNSSKSAADDNNDENCRSDGNWLPWHLAVNLSLTNDTRWPLYTVAWSQPVSNQEAIGIVGDYGILAVGGGDRIVRFFTFDEHSQILILIDSIHFDSEINCLSWRPVPTRQRQNSVVEEQKTDDDAEKEPLNSVNACTLPTSLQLAVAVDYGYVYLLQIGHPKTTLNTD